MTETRVLRTDDGRDIAYCEWGPSGGAPVFFLHGMPGSRLLRHAPELYDRAGVRVVTLDRAGWGRSTRDEGRTVASSARDVVAVADATGIDRFGVFGVSAGGPYALAVAAGAPGRVTACVTEIGIGPFDAPDLDFFAGMAPEEEAWYRECLEGGADFAERSFADACEFTESLPQSTEIPEPQRSRLFDGFGEGLRGGPDAFTDEVTAILRPWGFSLDDVICPVQVMVGREDENVPPAHGAWLVEHLRDAELITVEGGHIHPRDAEEEELLVWLAQHARS